MNIFETQNSIVEELRLVKPRFNGFTKILTILLLVVSDLVFFVFAALVANLARAVVYKEFLNFAQFQEITPFIGLSIILFFFRHLYPGIGISPVNELRRITKYTTFVFFFLGAVTFFLRNPEQYSRAHLALTWVFSLGALPVGRAITRNLFGQISLNGEPVVIIGYGNRGQEMVRFLQSNVAIGLDPVLVIDRRSKPRDGKNYINGVPVHHISDPRQMNDLSKQLKVKTAIIVTSEMPLEVLDAVEEIKEGAFKRLILIPDREQIGGLGIRKFDLGMVYGLEVKRNLFNTWQRFLKRTSDLILVLFGGLIISPILLLIALAIKLDSRGQLFYGHKRLGHNGNKFKAWKFRTMVPEADKVLKKYLEDNPDLKEEWESTFKLQNDPRITRVGKILRKVSLDELPQLWNVLQGEMSLVGPRPIVDDEVVNYGKTFDLYSFVKPGITGLWQVSGRNDTTYDERVRLDEFYVRNWSIWMDFYILAKTFSVIITRKGAY